MGMLAVVVVVEAAEAETAETEAVETVGGVGVADLLDRDREQELGGFGGEGDKWALLPLAEDVALPASSRLLTGPSPEEECGTFISLLVDPSTDRGDVDAAAARTSSSFPIGENGAACRLNSYSYSPASKYCGLPLLDVDVDVDAAEPFLPTVHVLAALDAGEGTLPLSPSVLLVPAVLFRFVGDAVDSVFTVSPFPLALSFGVGRRTLPSF